MKEITSINIEKIVENMDINKIVIDKITEDSSLNDMVDELLGDDNYNKSIKNKISDIIIEYLSTDKGKDLVIKSIKDYFENNNIFDIDGFNKIINEFILKTIKSKLKNE